MSTAVWQPPTGAPAGQDPDVRREVWVQSWVRDWISRTWGTNVFLALMCLLFGLPVSTILATLAVLALSLLMLLYRLKVGRTLPDMAQLLDEEPARLVEIEQLGRGVIRAEQKLLRVREGLRGERAWLVGPDDSGLAALFEEALPTPYAARVVDQPPRPGDRPAEQPRDPRGEAKRAAFNGLRNYVVGWGFVIAITVCIGLELAPQPRVLAALYVVAAAVIALLMTRSWLRRMRGHLGVDQLFEAPLVEHRARLHADRSFAVATEGGAELIAKIRWEHGVAANVRASGRLWIAGTPASGVTLGVGVPDFPIAGVIRFN
ncbi:hypothetical protein [Kutzneria sp. NPDC052558]|uniref:hypothetical protein n=1 Tax=Kutzneria sp. NPDC052558 TaxID=3364121 RepID=UPI0037CC0986